MQQEYQFVLESGPAALAELASYVGDAPYSTRIARRAIAAIEKRLSAEKKEAMLSGTHEEKKMQERGAKELADVLASLDFVFEGAAEIYALYEKSKPAFTDYAKVVVQRTYSGDKGGVHETWADIVVRVISATFYFRKVQLLSLENAKDADAVFSHEWDEKREQKLALETAISMYHVKWLPPGRGLQMMRKELVRRIGSMVLNNCGFVSTGYYEPISTNAALDRYHRLDHFNYNKRLFPYGAPHRSAEARRRAVETVLDAIEWGFNGLMSGVGVGFDTHFNELLVEPRRDVRETYVVPDTREGWAHSIRLLMASYLYENSRTVLFDYSRIRPKGAPIRTFGGTASGPGVLRLCHARIRAFLDCLLITQMTHGAKDHGLVVESQEEWVAVVNAAVARVPLKADTDDSIAVIYMLQARLPHEIEFLEEESPELVHTKHDEIKRWIASIEESANLHIYDCTRCIADILNAGGVCVRMGNLRRSAMIFLGSPDDATFGDLKDYERNVERVDIGGTSNNSYQIYDVAQYGPLAKRLAACVGVRGEPGLVNMVHVWRAAKVAGTGRLDKDDIELAEDAAEGINPCGETPLESYELCDLSEVFLLNAANKRDWYVACEHATRFAAVVSCIPTCSERTNRVIARNHRLGVSQTGLFAYYEKHCASGEQYSRRLRGAYRRIREVADDYVKKVAGVRPIRATVVKPSGTIAPLGNSPPGVHPPIESRYVIRRIRIARNKPLAASLIAQGVYYEVDVYDPTAYVFDFPLDQGDTRCASDVTMWELGEFAIATQRDYADNAVSLSLYIDKNVDTPAQIEAFLKQKMDAIKSISFMPRESEKKLSLSNGARVTFSLFDDHAPLLDLLRSSDYVAEDVAAEFAMQPRTAYPQSPYEAITRERYEAMVAAAPRLSFDGTPFDRGTVETLRGCDGLKCTLE